MNSAVENERGLDVDGIHLTSRHLMSITKRPEKHEVGRCIMS